MGKVFPMRTRRADRREPPAVQHDDHVNAWLAHYVAPLRVKPPRPPKPKPLPQHNAHSRWNGTAASPSRHQSTDFADAWARLRPNRGRHFTSLLSGYRLWPRPRRAPMIEPLTQENGDSRVTATAATCHASPSPAAPRLAKPGRALPSLASDSRLARSRLRSQRGDGHD